MAVICTIKKGAGGGLAPPQIKSIIGFIRSKIEEIRSKKAALTGEYFDSFKLLTL